MFNAPGYLVPLPANV